MGSFSWILPNNRIEPENPMVVFADELEIENLGLGASNSSSETNAQEDSEKQQDEEQEEKDEQDQQDQQKEQEEQEKQEEKQEEQIEEQELENIEQNDNRQQPGEDSGKAEEGNQIKDGNGEAIEGDGDIPSDKGDQGTENPGEGDDTGDDDPGLVTDLYNRIIAISELEEDVLHFYAYYSDKKVDANIRVNYKHKSDTGSGTYLNADDTNYQAKLRLGTNYITIYYSDAGGVRHYSRFIINYQADKADKDNPEVGKHPTNIETNLDNWQGPIKTTEFTLTVRARTWENKQIYSNQIQVMMDGKVISNPTGSSTYEYELFFPVPREGEVTHHTITVLAWDDEGNSRFITYNVEYHFHDTGSVIGTVRVSIDATTVGLGILDSDTVELIQGETTAHVVTRMLDNNGYEFNHAGTLDNGFYLRSITRGDTFRRAKIDSRLKVLLERDGITFTSPSSRDKLGEFDFTRDSGWLYSVNGALYPGKSMSAWKLNDGDTVHIRFTLASGKDVGGNVNDSDGMTSYCGKWIEGTFIPLNHNFVESDRLEPTATEAGYIEHMCSKCHEKKREELPATGGSEEPPEIPDPPEEPELPDPPDEEPEIPDPPDEESEEPEVPDPPDEEDPEN